MHRVGATWWAGAMGVALVASVSCDHGGAAKSTSVQNSAVASRFLGAGKGGAGLSIGAGTVSVTCAQPGPAPGGSQGPAPGADAKRECYYDAAHPDPAATMEWVVESAPEGELIHARLTFNPWFVDNTYGENAIGWGTAQAAMPKPGGMAMPKPGGMAMPKPGKGGHTFKDLVGSDHAEFTLTDGAGAVQLKFKADYISESADAPSGYRSLGVTGGEGKMLVGSAADVVAVSTSLDRDLNTCGYAGYTVDSPGTTDQYVPNADAPNWDFRVVYDVWVKRSAFSAGFGRASVEFVHASPSKTGSNTIDVTPRECPPTWPPYCTQPDGCQLPPRCGDEPDEFCTNYPPCEGAGCPGTMPPGDICGDEPDEFCTNHPPCDGGNCPQETDAGVGTVF